MSTPFQIPRPIRSNGQQAGPRQRPRTTQAKPAVNKYKTGGGFNVTPSVNVSFVKQTGAPSPAADTGQPTAGGQAAGRGTPGSEFMSNEDIRAFSEHVRKNARNRSVERAMDAEQLEAVLRHIPTDDGSMAGARLRSRRVSRHLKKIARAEQLIAKEAAAMYAQFEREYESNLRKVGKARPPQPVRFQF